MISHLSKLMISASVGLLIGILGAFAGASIVIVFIAAFGFGWMVGFLIPSA